MLRGPDMARREGWKTARMAERDSELKQLFRNLGGSSSALQVTLRAGDADGLLAFLTSPQGERVPRRCDDPAAIAAATGDTRCLRVFQECGFVLSDATWAKAAEHGRPQCFAFAVSHGYELKDSVLDKSVRNGHLGCVDFLLQQGLPRRRPFLPSLNRTRPDQLECLQLMLDKDVAIHPQTLIAAARVGDLDFVRWLHQRGVPLWDKAQDWRIMGGWWEPPHCDPMCQPRLWGHGGGMMGSARRWRQPSEVPPGTLFIPLDKGSLQGMWGALRYGAGHGAPINDRAKQILEEKRRRTHAVLLCSKAAARVCQGAGRAKKRRVRAGMAALPSALVEELLILADLEILESILRRPPLEDPAVAG